MDSVVIREATAADEADVLDILSHHIAPDNIHAYYESLPTDRFFDDADPTAFYVAVDEESGRVVGTTALHHYAGARGVLDALKGETLPGLEVLQDDGAFDGVGYLATAYVHEEWLRQGVGRALRNHAEAAARSHGLEAIFVEVWGHDEARDARRPLRRSAYEEVFTSDRYWPPSVRDDPDVRCSACGADCTCIGAVYRKLL